MSHLDAIEKAARKQLDDLETTRDIMKANAKHAHEQAREYERRAYAARDEANTLRTSLANALSSSSSDHQRWLRGQLERAEEALWFSSSDRIRSVWKETLTIVRDRHPELFADGTEGGQ